MQTFFFLKHHSFLHLDCNICNHTIGFKDFAYSIFVDLRYAKVHKLYCIYDITDHFRVCLFQNIINWQSIQVRYNSYIRFWLQRMNILFYQTVNNFCALVPRWIVIETKLYTDGIRFYYVQSESVRKI